MNVILQVKQGMQSTVFKVHVYKTTHNNQHSKSMIIVHSNEKEAKAFVKSKLHYILEDIKAKDEILEIDKKINELTNLRRQKIEEAKQEFCKKAEPVLKQLVNDHPEEFI